MDPILWTTVPNGHSKTDPTIKQLSVVASPVPPRGGENDTYGDVVGTVWDNWTESVLDENEKPQIVFAIQYTNSPLTSNQDGTAIEPQPAPILPKGEIVPHGYDARELWQRLFPLQKPMGTETHARQIFAHAKMTHSHAQNTGFSKKWLTSAHSRSLSKFLDQEEGVSQDLKDAIQGRAAEGAASGSARRSLNWLKPPALAKKSSAFSDQFLDWIKDGRLQPSNKSEIVAEARRAERNMYRLSPSPWTSLDDDALTVAWYVALDVTDTNDPRVKNDPMLKTVIDRFESLKKVSNNKVEALKLALFHGRVPKKGGAKIAKERAARTVPTFCQKIAMLNGYPQLMRKLGLIFDFATAAQLPRDTTCIRVCVNVTQKGATSQFGTSPWTLIDPTSFLAKPSPSQQPGPDLYVKRMLNSSQLVVDSLAHNSQMLRLIAQTQSSPGPAGGASQQETTPAPKNDGIIISLTDRATSLGDRLAQPLPQDPQQLPPVGLESLIHGYVPYIAEEGTNDFVSLCARNEMYSTQDSMPTVTYTPEPPPSGCFTGYVASTAATTHDTTSSDPTSSDATAADLNTPKDAHIHESIVRWNGRSLGTKDSDDPPAKLNKSDQYPLPTPPGYAPLVQPKFGTPKKSPAPLYFGMTYQFQLACMDIAGNVPEPDPNANPNVTTPPFNYLRYDPVPPPEILLAEHLCTSASPGEQLTQLVVRSDGEQDSQAETLRVIVPPQSSVSLARQCGVFDKRAPGENDNFDEVFLYAVELDSLDGKKTKNAKFPSDYTEFQAADIIDLATFCRNLVQPDDDAIKLVSNFILSGSGLDAGTQQDVTKAQSATGDNQQLREKLARHLNGLIKGRAIDEGNLFNQVKLGTETKAVQRLNPEGTELIVLHRLLLEDTYPGQLARGHQNPIYQPPIYRPEQVRPPSCLYLPDPFADGIMVHVTDLSSNRPVRFGEDRTGSTANRNGRLFLTLPYYSEGREWPRAEMYLLALKCQSSDSRDVSVGMEQRTIRGAGFRRFKTIVVSVPVGKEVSVSLHSWISPELSKLSDIGSKANRSKPEENSNLAKMAVFHSSREGFLNSHSPADPEKQRSIYHRTLGQYPTSVVAPARDLTLIHAIPAPRLAPKIDSLMLTQRQAGETFQAFEHVQVSVDRASTGVIHLSSNWEEWLDNGPSSAPPARTPKKQPVCEVSIAPAQSLMAPDSPTFTADDIVDLQGLADALVAHPPATDVTAWLMGCLKQLDDTLGNQTIKNLNQLPPSIEKQSALKDTLADYLSRIISSGEIYEKGSFDAIKAVLPPSTRQLQALHPQGKALVVLNRLLIEAAYIDKGLAQSPPISQGCSEEPLDRTPVDDPMQIELHGAYQAFPRLPGKIRQDFGDTRHRVVDYVLSGSSRFGDYFSPEILSTDRTSGTFQVSVLNTGKPSKPEIANIIPTFGWEKSGTTARFPNGVKSARIGGGCRIWLRRPWYITGDHEQLGIVVWDEEYAAHGDDPAREMVTRWGADPIWDDDASTRGPKPSEIRGEMIAGSPVSLSQNTQPNLKAMVIPFTPKYDRDNDLLYVDALLSNVPSYFSFIRFGLVRYQPNSISGCQFSDVATADFVQLTPSRCVTINPTDWKGMFGPRAAEVILSGDLSNRGNFYSLQVQHLWDLGGSGQWWRCGEEIRGEFDDGDQILARWNNVSISDGNRRKRLVVREYEEFEQDKPAGGDLPSGKQAAKRLVFADVLEI